MHSMNSVKVHKIYNVTGYLLSLNVMLKLKAQELQQNEVMEDDAHVYRGYRQEVSARRK